MKQQLLKKTVLLFAFIGLLSTQLHAQETFTFDTTVEGWTANGNPPNTYAASIAYDAGSGSNLGLAVISPKEDPTNLGTTLTQNTAMYGPNNGSGGINADAYNTFTVTLKNETAGTILRVRCKPNGGNWSQQNFTISANDTVFKTYTFTLNSTQWNGTDSDIAFVVRNTAGAWTSGTQVSYDSLTIFNPATYDGFVQNPSFDDVPGDIAPWNPASQTFASVDVTTGDARTGSYSMTHTYSAVPTATHTVFNTYVHDIGSTITDAVASSLWVKVVRPSTPGVSPLVTIRGQVRTGVVPGTLALKSNNQTTTKTDGTWEKVTFNDLTPDAAYSYAQFRYGVLVTNLLAGDIVYIDDLSAINIPPGCTTPTDVTGFTVTDAGATQLDLAWTNTTCFDEILVVAKEASAVNETPVNGTTYAGDAIFGNGIELGTSTGEYAVYNGTGTSVSVTGLTDSTVYHFSIFTRRGTTWTTAGVTGSGTPTAPLVTFDGFVQNPSFDDVPGDSAPWNPATKPYATVDVSTGDAHTGTYSMTHTYHTIAPSGGAHFVFNDYVHNIGSTITDAVASSLWVKVVRPSTPGVSPLVSIQGQVRTGTSDVVSSLVNKTNNKTTTKTDGTWEKLTFNLLTPDAPYSHAQFRYGLLVTNLQIGDIVYIDDLSAMNIPAETTAQTGNWEDPLTWVSGNVPDANTDVTIAHTVTINSNAECFAMSINNTVSTFVSVNPGNSLTIETDVTTSNDIFLLSNSASFSSLIVKGAINGQIAYQRFVGAESTRDLISVPVTGLTFGSFSTAGANSQLFENPADPTEKLFGPFDNSTGVYENYDEVVDAAVTLVPGKGYRAATNAGSTLRFKSTATTSDVSIAITDETATGTGNYKKWNLIGNPYPSYLDFEDFFTENSSEFDTSFQAIYGYHNNTNDGSSNSGTVINGKWAIWNNATIINLAVLDEKIAPGQGFFVKAKAGAGTLPNDTQVTFKPAMRVLGTAGDEDFIVGRNANVNSAMAVLQLNIDSSIHNTYIYFIDEQTRGLDPGYDAGAFQGNSGGLFTHLIEDNTGVEMAIQALPYQDFNDVVVPLGVNSNAGVQLTLGLDASTATIPSNINVYLEDNVTNTWTLLNTSDYTFTPIVSLNGTGRFYIHFSNAVLSVKDDTFSGLNIYTEQSTNQVVIKGAINTETSATIFDIQGRVVMTKELKINSTTNTIDVSNVFAGVYIVKLQNTSGSRTQKVILR